MSIIEIIIVIIIIPEELPLHLGCGEHGLEIGEDDPHEAEDGLEPLGEDAAVRGEVQLEV